MAALPNGYADTGITKTMTLTLTLELGRQVFSGGQAVIEGFEFNVYASAGATYLGTPDGARYSAIEARWREGGGAETVYATGASPATGDPGYLTALTFTKTKTNLRLGVKVKSSVFPPSDTHVYPEYIWFADASTVTTWAINGTTVKTTAATDPPYPSCNRINFYRVTNDNFGDPSLNFTSTYDHVRFDGFDYNTGAVTEPSPYVYKYYRGPTVTQTTLNFFPPTFWTMDLDCDETDGTAEAANATQDGARTCPAVYTQERVNFAGGDIFTGPPTPSTAPATAVLANPWLAAQTVTPYAGDQNFECVGMDPLDPDNTAPTSWTVGTVTVAASRSVLASANAWTVTTGAATVGGTSTVPTFNVTTAPCTVSRDLLSYWRNWNLTADARYHADDAYTTTKTDYYSDTPTPDIWGWGTYGFLDVDMTVPAGSDTVATFKINWAIVRKIPFSAVGIDTFETNYTVTFPAGARSTQRIDLLFPAETASRPLYVERVDRVRISGLGPGNHTLHSLTLVGVEQPYLRFGGRTIYRDGLTGALSAASNAVPIYGGVVLSCDGSAPALHFGEDLVDNGVWYHGDNQNGKFNKSGGALLHYGKAPGMDAASLSATFTELNRMEGVTATASLATMNADLTDTFGVVLRYEPSSGSGDIDVPQLPSWFLPTWPHVRLTYGVATNIAARTVFTGVAVPPGLLPAQMRIYQRNTLGGVVDAVVTDASFNRQGVGVVVKLRGFTDAAGAPNPSDPLLGTASTDAKGFVTLPHRTGKLGVAEFTVYPTE